MSRRILRIAVAALLLVTSVQADASDPGAQPVPFREQFQLANIDGPTLVAELAAMKERPRLYSFWASWCGPCVRELPTLRAVAKARPDLEVVLINMDEPTERRGKVYPLLRRNKLDNVRNLLMASTTPGATLKAALPDWTGALPFHIFVRADGTVYDAKQGTRERFDFLRSADQMLRGN